MDHMISNINYFSFEFFLIWTGVVDVYTFEDMGEYTRTNGEVDKVFRNQIRGEKDENMLEMI